MVTLPIKRNNRIDLNMTKVGKILSAIFLLTCSVSVQGRTWTLEECIKYALENNISLKKTGLTRQNAMESTLSSKAQLLPGLNFSTAHNVSYKPWQEKGTALVADGRVQSSIDNTAYNATYGLSANWTVWNGNRNHNQVKANRLSEKDVELDSLTQVLNLQEQITKYYIQILYSKEAINVNKATLEAARVNEKRGEEMVKVGSMSKADLSQLVSQRAQDEYNMVQAENNVRSYTRQLKQLLQIVGEEEFDVVSPAYSDAMAMNAIPSVSSVYNAALEHRPEIKKAQLAVQAADIQKKIATAQRMPTVSLTGNVATSHTTMSKQMWKEQMQKNVSIGAGVNISVPIFEQRTAKTARNKAEIQRQQALLDIQDKQTALYSTIEDYWINAENSQNQYRSAKVGAESAQTSYDLLSEQFRLGLKNIVELQESKTRLLSAQQSELQSKYTTIFNLMMLDFYKR